MWRVAWLVMRKDLRVEWRSRVVTVQIVPFGVMALVLCGLAEGPVNVNQPGSAPGLFYVVLFLASLLIINRSRSLESARGTRASVSSLGLDPSAVFLGKAAAVAVELILSAAVLAAGATDLLHVPLAATIRAFPTIALTSLALAAAGTLYGALSGGGSAGATLLPIISIPAFAPLLIAGERTYSAAVEHHGSWRWILISLVAVVVYSTVGFLLYGVVDES
jgi:heme exporter protein B